MFKLNPMTLDSPPPKDPSNFSSEAYFGKTEHFLYLHGADGDRPVKVRIPLYDLAQWFNARQMGTDGEKIRKVLLRDPTVLATIEQKARRKIQRDFPSGEVVPLVLVDLTQ